MRHLYLLKDVPQFQKDNLISTAKNMERRRCNHHTLDEPLSTLDCLKSVIDPKSSLTNKNRYVVASQDEEVRRFCRGLKGVPLVFVRRSVMIMEPMAESSVHVREGIEKSKFRSGLSGRRTAALGKRKREQDGIPDSDGEATVADPTESIVKQKKVRGPKGPNPLAVKKPKKDSVDIRPIDSSLPPRSAIINPRPEGEIDFQERELVAEAAEQASSTNQNHSRKRKRKRKPDTKIVNNLDPGVNIEGSVV